MSDPRSQVITLGGVSFHYLDWGNDGAPPVVLLHGFAGHARQWRFAAEALHPHFHVLALDQRGHGDSDWTETYGSRVMVEDLARFVDALDLHHVTIVGQSMGGMNAMAYAAMHPERIDRVVLGDIGPETASAGVQRIREHVQQRDTFSSVDDAFEFERSQNPRAQDWMLRERVEHNLRELPDGSLTWKYDKALRENMGRQPEPSAREAGTPPSSEAGPKRPGAGGAESGRAEFNAEERWQMWRKIQAQVLVVRGEESDLLSPEIARRMLDELPNAELVTLPGAGHTLMADQPEAFVAAVRDWLLPRE